MIAKKIGLPEEKVGTNNKNYLANRLFFPCLVMHLSTCALSQTN